MKKEQPTKDRIMDQYSKYMEAADEPDENDVYLLKGAIEDYKNKEKKEPSSDVLFNLLHGINAHKHAALLTRSVIEECERINKRLDDMQENIDELNSLLAKAIINKEI